MDEQKKLGEWVRLGGIPMHKARYVLENKRLQPEPRRDSSNHYWLTEDEWQRLVVIVKAMKRGPKRKEVQS